MSEYKALLKDRQALDQKIEDARRKELSTAVEQVRSLVNEFGLTPKEVFATGRPRGVVLGSKVEPKYIDPVSKKTWTGRGKAPKWIAGQDRSLFLI